MRNVVIVSIVMICFAGLIGLSFNSCLGTSSTDSGSLESVSVDSDPGTDSAEEPVDSESPGLPIDVVESPVEPVTQEVVPGVAPETVPVAPVVAPK